jgi:hypothetical protein
LNNPIGSEDNCAADDESDIAQNNGMYDPECPELQDANTWPNVPGSVRPIRKSKTQAETVLVIVNAIETRRNK